MRDARPEGSPYPKADVALRGLARGVDFLVAFAMAQLGHELGAILAVVYLLLADGFLHGQSPGKRIFGVRAMQIPRRAPASYRESMLRNADFALIALFYVVPLGWILLLLVGVPVTTFASTTWVSAKMSPMRIPSRSVHTIQASKAITGTPTSRSRIQPSGTT